MSSRARPSGSSNIPDLGTLHTVAFGEMLRDRSGDRAELVGVEVGEDGVMFVGRDDRRVQAVQAGIKAAITKLNRGDNTPAVVNLGEATFTVKYVKKKRSPMALQGEMDLAMLEVTSRYRGRTYPVLPIYRGKWKDAALFPDGKWNVWRRG